MTTLTRRDVLALRLRAQRLAEPAPGPAQVVDDMVAVQGQDLGAVLWAIARRTPGASADDVRAAFTRGEIVRSWPMRGTLHAVASTDLHALLDLTAGRTLTSMTRRRAELAITDADVAVVRDVALTLLGAAPARRAALLAAFEEAGQTTSGQRGYHLIVTLALEGVLACGPFDGDEQLFALLAPRAGARPAAEDTLRGVALRYVRARGPVTVADLAWWTKLPLTGWRGALAALAAGGAVVEVQTGGGPAWVDPAVLDALGAPGAGRADVVALLPGFDELLLGYADRTASLDVAHASSIVPGGNGVFRPVLTHRGRVLGTWMRRRSGDVVDVRLEPFVGALPGVVLRRARAEARRYAAFLGARLGDVGVSDQEVDAQ